MHAAAYLLQILPTKLPQRAMIGLKKVTEILSSCANFAWRSPASHFLVSTSGFPIIKHLFYKTSVPVMIRGCAQVELGGDQLSDNKSNCDQRTTGIILTLNNFLLSWNSFNPSGGKRGNPEGREATRRGGCGGGPASGEFWICWENTVGVALKDILSSGWEGGMERDAWLGEEI